jgi:hypothetical protein
MIRAILFSMEGANFEDPKRRTKKCFPAPTCACNLQASTWRNQLARRRRKSMSKERGFFDILTAFGFVKDLGFRLNAESKLIPN